MPTRFLHPRASGLMTFGGGGGDDMGADIDKLGNRGYAPGGDVTGSPDAGKEADLQNSISKDSLLTYHNKIKL